MKTITITDPAKLFFTADTHFGHERLLPYRKYASADEMDLDLQRRWNTAVPEGSTVFHLGDVSFRNRDQTQAALSVLNGTIKLVPGNHDKGARFGSLLEVLSPLVEIKVLDGQEPTRIVLCHFPLHSWNRMHYGAWHLHGHCHGSLPGFGRRQDVGWDVFRAPVSYQQLKSLVGDKQIKSFDHHQPVPHE